MTEGKYTSDLYARLDVARDASKGWVEIVYNWKSLYLSVLPLNDSVERERKALKFACAVLSNPERRARYDAANPDAGKDVKGLEAVPIDYYEGFQPERPVQPVEPVQPEQYVPPQLVPGDWHLSGILGWGYDRIHPLIEGTDLPTRIVPEDTRSVVDISGFPEVSPQPVPQPEQVPPSVTPEQPYEYDGPFGRGLVFTIDDSLNPENRSDK
jgi:hypothetical protein